MITFIQKVSGKYFERKPRKGFVTLFLSKNLIQGAAAAMMGVFLPIFLYTTSGNNFQLVAAFYGINSFLYMVLLAFGAQMMNRYGFRRSLVTGALFSVAFYSLLFFATPENIFKLIIPLFIALLLLRTFHWVPYHVDFAKFTNNKNRGREVSVTFATVAFLGVVGPVLAGYIIEQSGYQVLFGIVVLLLVGAAISYSFVPRTREKFTWSYRRTWKEFFSKERRGAVLAMTANGAETGITVVVWPIFIYEVVNGNFLQIGALSTLIVGVTIAVQLFFGKRLDRGERGKQTSLRFGSVFYALGWVIKIFVISATQIFFVGLYHNVMKIFMKTSFDTLIYDMSADQGHYVDEFSVLREMATHLGRTIALLITSILAIFVAVQWTFVIAAAAALALNSIYYVHHSVTERD